MPGSDVVGAPLGASGFRCRNIRPLYIQLLPPRRGSA